MEQHWLKKLRILMVALIFSVALNIGLIATCFLRQDPLASVAFDGALQKNFGESSLSNHHLLNAMAKLSFRELVAQLTNRELVEDGYSKRDLALAALVAFRHFNLEKALGSLPQQRRAVDIAAGSVELYPGLQEESFDAIIRFAYKEKWPLTPKGLFELLQKLPSPREESLCQAFAMTPEFCSLQLLFHKTDAAQDLPTLLLLAREGTWDLISGFTKEQAQLLDLSVEKRRRLLLSYLAQRSHIAAKLLLKTDFEFVFKRLDDRGISDMLSLLDERTDEAYNFCAALLVSARSDLVRTLSAEKLYAYAGEALPTPLDIQAAMARFCPTLKSAAPVVPVIAAAPLPDVPAKQARYHTVLDGDTLWKIARQYKVKVEDVVQLNGIEGGHLYPGMTLQLP